MFFVYLKRVRKYIGATQAQHCLSIFVTTEHVIQRDGLSLCRCSRRGHGSCRMRGRVYRCRFSVGPFLHGVFRRVQPASTRGVSSLSRYQHLVSSTKRCCARWCTALRTSGNPGSAKCSRLRGKSSSWCKSLCVGTRTSTLITLAHIHTFILALTHLPTLPLPHTVYR